jgi:hypothetical protein
LQHGQPVCKTSLGVGCPFDIDAGDLGIRHLLTGAAQCHAVLELQRSCRPVGDDGQDTAEKEESHTKGRKDGPKGRRTPLGEDQGVDARKKNAEFSTGKTGNPGSPVETRCVA